MGNTNILQNGGCGDKKPISNWFHLNVAAQSNQRHNDGRSSFDQMAFLGKILEFHDGDMSSLWPD